MQLTIRYLVFISLLLFLFNNCTNKDENKCKKYYNFSFSPMITPVKDKFVTGDTIWIKLDYRPDGLINLTDSSLIKTSAIDMKFRTFIYQLDYSQFQLYRKHQDFIIVNKIGNVTKTKDYLDLHFTVFSDKRSISFGLVPKKTGYYRLQFDLGLFACGMKTKLVSPECEEYVSYFFDINEKYHSIQNPPFCRPSSFSFSVKRSDKN